MTTYHRSTVETFRVTFGSAVFCVVASTPLAAGLAATVEVTRRLKVIPEITLVLEHDTRDAGDVILRASGPASWEMRLRVERSEPAERWTAA